MDLVVVFFSVHTITMPHGELDLTATIRRGKATVLHLNYI